MKREEVSRKPSWRLIGMGALVGAAIPLAVAIAPLYARAISPDQPASMQDFDAKALQGDLKAGVAILDRIPANSLGLRERIRRESLLARFKDGKLPQVDVKGPLTRDVADVYMKYWHRCLLKETELPAANAELFEKLKVCLKEHGKDSDRFSSLDELTEALGPMIEEEGIHSLRGVTAPYYELMLWKDETTRPYTVELPESTEQVNVVLMSHFVLFGWLGFATCDKQHTGGWTTKDTLYCLRDSYNLDSENFRVSYLAHEAQHFADARQFPKLEQPEREYRAKLVELARAENTLYDLLRVFTKQSGKDRSSPHAFANLHVVQDMSNALFGDGSASENPELWSKKDRKEIHVAAEKRLRANTLTLQAKGADSVKRCLAPD